MRLFEIEIVPMVTSGILAGWTVCLRHDGQPAKIKITGLEVEQREVDGKAWSCFSSQTWGKILGALVVIHAHASYSEKMRAALNAIVPQTPVDRLVGSVVENDGVRLVYHWYYHDPGREFGSSAVNRASTL